jgi:exosortase/archaeosortase family protein
MNLRQLLQRNKDALRFCLWFLFYLMAVHLLFSKDWLGRWVEIERPIALWATWLSGIILNGLGWQTSVFDTTLVHQQVSVQVAKGCDGLVASMIYFAAVMAFPATFPRKAIGLLMGFVAIQILNQARIIALFLTLIYLPDVFEDMHVYVTQSLVIAFGVVLWYFWAERIAKAPVS